MRYDFLSRFESRFGDNGFKRFINEGYQFKNTHYNYIPTKTAPGHASVYTGTTPFIHGIIANDWYSREEGKEIYCADDHTVKTVGSSNDLGEMSPKNLKTTTITDELRLSNQFKSKVVGISIKDRGAIMPTGHSGLALWFDKKEGGFISSTFYTDHLPKWVNDFNAKGLSKKYKNSIWNTKYDISTYVASRHDDEPNELPLDGLGTKFPYDLSKLDTNFEPMVHTPYGNQLLTELALEAIDKAELGEDDFTDFLAISFSSTDKVGHDTGPYSVEVEDTYLRLDDDLARIFSKLDEKIGKGNYTVFLTADHAVSPIPQYVLDNKFYAGYFDKVEFLKKINKAINQRFGGDNWAVYDRNNNIYLDHNLVEDSKYDLSELRLFVRDQLMKEKGIADVYTSDEIRTFSHADKGIQGMLARGFNLKRGGDIVYVLDPFWITPYFDDATGHGSGYTYDTHVPLLWYGNGIKKGQTTKYHTITQIAPTISMMLDIALPSGAMSEPLYELLEE